MPASVHIADLGLRSLPRLLRGAPAPRAVRGLRRASAGFAVPLSKSVMPHRPTGRVGLVAFWDDDAAIDGFLADHPLAEALAGGWHARLEPIRAFGAWRGLDAVVPRGRNEPHGGPVAVLTLGRLRLSQAPRFLKTSAMAEGAALGAAWRGPRRSPVHRSWRRAPCGSPGKPRPSTPTASPVPATRPPSTSTGRSRSTRSRPSSASRPTAPRVRSTARTLWRPARSRFGQRRQVRSSPRPSNITVPGMTRRVRGWRRITPNSGACGVGHCGTIFGS